MNVDTAKVTGRRSVHFDRLEEVLAEAQRLAAGQVRALGNWNLGQICMHLARAIEGPLDGPPLFEPPWFVRIAARTVLRKRLLTRPLPSGFKLPKAGASLLPEPGATTAEGLASLERAVERWRREKQRYPNGLLGQLSPEEWEQFQCRHAETHLSFLIPGG